MVRFVECIVNYGFLNQKIPTLRQNIIFFIEFLEVANFTFLANFRFLTLYSLLLFLFSQTLAIYDRFGRLMYGGENLIKDCLDYVVFEKHLSDEYGRWRLHGKIVPEWMPRAEPIRRTMRQPDVEEDETMEYTLLKEDSVKDNAKEATA